MMFTFTLTINGGNEAMSTRSDVANALREVAKRLSGIPDDTSETRAILDANGNTVGTWEYSPKIDDEPDVDADTDEED